MGSAGNNNFLFYLEVRQLFLGKPLQGGLEMWWSFFVDKHGVAKYFRKLDDIFNSNPKVLKRDIFWKGFHQTSATFHSVCWHFFTFLPQHPFTTSETGVILYHQKLNARVSAGVTDDWRLWILGNWGILGKPPSKLHIWSKRTYWTIVIF